MTKSEETRLQNLSRKQGFEKLDARDLKELKRLTEKKSAELKASRSTRKSF
jgi:hypothetical protein